MTRGATTVPVPPDAHLAIVFQSLKSEFPGPGQSKATWGCPYGYCYRHCCSFPSFIPMVVSYISISRGLSNLVFKMGTMSPFTRARTVCQGEEQVWLPACPQAVHQASRGRSRERLQVPGSSSVQAGELEQVFSHSLPSALLRRKPLLHGADTTTSPVV